MKQIAESPIADNYGDQVQQTYDKVCKNCWSGIVEEFIKGIWSHGISGSGRSHEGCIRIDPINYNSPKMKNARDNLQYSCYHNFRFNEYLTNAVKCTKCGVPARFGIFDAVIAGISSAYCYTCKKYFKNVETHIKKHKHKGFEFKILPTVETMSDAL